LLHSHSIWPAGEGWARRRTECIRLRRVLWGVNFLLVALIFAKPAAHWSPSLSVLTAILSRDRKERWTRLGTAVEGRPRDLAAVIDVASHFESEIGTGRDEVIQIHHYPVLPKKGAWMAEARTVRYAHDLTCLVDSQSFANGVSRERAEVAHAAFFGPKESVEFEREIPVDQVPALVGESHDLPLVIDRGRRVPSMSSDIAKVDRLAVLPQYGVLGAECSYSILTNTRDANDLTIVVDGCSSRVGVIPQPWKLVDLAVPRAPNDSFEL